MNNICEIERYVDGTMEQHEAILFEARIQKDSLLRMNVLLHKKVLALVRIYHRKKLKMELEEVHNRLFNDPNKFTFRESVMRIFRNG